MANKAKDVLGVGTGHYLVPNSPFSICWKTGLLICAIFMLAQFAANAQKLSKYYTKLSQPEGMVYFIKPQSNFSNFIMDVTYLDYKDTAVINFTFFDREDITPETLTIKYDNWHYQSDVKQIYIDRKKKQWIYRYSFRIPFEQLVLFYSAKAPSLTITTSSSRIITIKPVKRWKKNLEINNSIIVIIQRNKTNQ
jgi:hypothetical protein